MEALARHRETLAVVEVLHVEPEAAVGLDVDQMLFDQIAILRCAVGCQTHQLVLTAAHLEAAVIRERGVQKAERVRKLQMLGECDRIARAEAHRRRAPLADAVKGENCSLLKRTRVESTRRMTFVMVGEHKRRAKVAAKG